jgi:hypothetical protein
MYLLCERVCVRESVSVSLYVCVCVCVCVWVMYVGVYYVCGCVGGSEAGVFERERLAVKHKETCIRSLLTLGVREKETGGQRLNPTARAPPTPYWWSCSFFWPRTVQFLFLVLVLVPLALVMALVLALVAVLMLVPLAHARCTRKPLTQEFEASTLHA